ncbi:MAG: hypothetical protein A3I24_01895 [Candidatus Harrisonbacteria bacterium RIFCSPLOWO2_02_FULL_41_13b]|uniref:Putative gluconeogenesis factor n=1 Tax=Candidatus Harrisonbacteria bacterium RIFCSPLOWO2_02_FULL_41_13b TaxID=1798409 RepID=A0A1G1ZS19_9BACT|nr:MAG: hypothetical protein A3J53_02225 [Candidatus Harrisonbacteria bacterium RIFCSPHIGHO2_02_FULL_40_20]OGY67354.1 MAG: hypothetical protein A3I24_01895 [Candidatus Harrisonbacteria bacterium RIFCSPLOWO2_02_FULL_41_13b]
MKSDKKIVVIGGGTGVFTVLTGLKKYFNNLTAVVTMADDGGSTGILREEFGILPPGDVRRAIVALSSSDNKTLSELFNYRFKEGKGLSGHSLGNLIITALERITGSFDKAIDEVGKILQVKGKILPVTLKTTYLMAELEDGSLVKGETNIDIPRHDGFLKIKKVWLRPAVSINPDARKAILGADAVIIGPGDLYTSLVPNLLVGGMKDALWKTRGKVIYFVNTMTKFGETHSFQASDFLSVVENYLGKRIVDFVAINKTKPTPNRLRPYAEEKSEFVNADLENLPKKPVPIVASLIRRSGLLRHDPEKVAKLVKMLV